MMDVGVWPREEVRTIVNRDFHSNTYLFRTGVGCDCVVVDPGLDLDALKHELTISGWQPTGVMCTHGHFDHVGSAAWVQSTYKVPVYLHASDLKLAKMSNFMLAAFKLKQRITLPKFQLVGNENSHITCGTKSFAFHGLPGHTPGSAGISVDDLFFSGDSLYARKTALSKLPGEDHAMLRASLTHLFSWIEGAVRVLPGHGGSATVDEIRLHNTELRAFMTAD